MASGVKKANDGPIGRMLVVSWCVPPHTTGSGAVLSNLARQFTRDEMIIVGEKPYEKSPLEWDDRWPRVFYGSKAWPEMRRGQRWWRYLQIPVFLARSIMLAKKYRCSSILAVFPREEHLFIGYLTSLLTGARLFPYFHNTYLDNRKGTALRFAGWLQPRVLRRASHAFLMSEGMAELFREKYPYVECSPLLHSFNEALPEYSPPPPPHDPMRVIFFGNINESCRDALSRSFRAVNSYSGAALTIQTAVPRRYAESIGLTGEGLHCGLLPRERLFEALAESDVFLLPHGFSGGLSEVEYRTIFPTKMIEYLLGGRPILAHAPAHSYVSKFLRENDCALVVDEPSEDAIVQGLKRLAGDGELRARLVANALKTAARFQASVVAAGFRAIVNGQAGG